MNIIDNNELAIDNYNYGEPKLSIMTRHIPVRVNFLKNCKASLDQQTGRNFEHWILTDKKMKGALYANSLFEKCLQYTNLNGKYVMILDDDDHIIEPTFFEQLFKLFNNDYDIIFFKGIIGQKILPIKWPAPPKYSDIGSFNFCVKSEYYIKYCNVMSIPPKLDKDPGRGEDFKFINTVFQNTKKHFWFDIIACSTQTNHHSFGKLYDLE